jgi:hypothetical protein
MKRIALLTLFAIAVTGCATNYAEKSAEEVAATVEIKDSEFDSQKIYSARRAFSETKRFPFTDNESVWLAAVRDKKTGVTRYVLAIEVVYTGSWRFYETVSFVGGETATATPLNKQVVTCTSGVGCLQTEAVSIPVSLSTLQAANPSLRFRMNSRSGHENIITLPKPYIEGLLAAARQ